jgi:hypothetical protein
MTRAYLFKSALATVILITIVALVGVMNRVRTKPVHKPVSAKDAVNADVGDKLCVPGVDFSIVERTIVVAISSKCPFSKTSEEFLRLLASAAHRSSTPIYCLAGVAPHQLPHLASNVRVLEVSGGRIGLYRIPASAVVNRKGIISALWTGNVQAVDAPEVVHSLLAESPNRTSGFQSVTEADMRARRTVDASPQVIDPSEDEESLRAPTVASNLTWVSIPASELSIRAPYELDRDRPVVVDCRQIGSLRCQAAMTTLRFHGFRIVGGLGLRRMGFSPTCSTGILDWFKVHK